MSVNIDYTAPMEVVFDPANEFDAALIDIKRMHDAKSEGYGSKEDSLQNFYDIAAQMSGTPLEACEYLFNKHHSALKQWFNKGRRRERTLFSNDAFLDRAVYGIISLVLYRRGSN